MGDGEYIAMCYLHTTIAYYNIYSSCRHINRRQYTCRRSGLLLWYVWSKDIITYIPKGCLWYTITESVLIYLLIRTIRVYIFFLLQICHSQPFPYLTAQMRLLCGECACICVPVWVPIIIIVVPTIAHFSFLFFFSLISFCVVLIVVLSLICLLCSIMIMAMCFRMGAWFHSIESNFAIIIWLMAFSSWKGHFMYTYEKKIHRNFYNLLWKGENARKVFFNLHTHVR